MVNQLLATEFKKVVQEECGLILSDSEAQLVLSGLVSYFDLLAEIAQREVNKE